MCCSEHYHGSDLPRASYVFATLPSFQRTTHIYIHIHTYIFISCMSLRTPYTGSLSGNARISPIRHTLCMCPLCVCIGRCLHHHIPFTGSCAGYARISASCRTLCTCLLMRLWVQKLDPPYILHSLLTQLQLCWHIADPPPSLHADQQMQR